GGGRAGRGQPTPPPRRGAGPRRVRGADLASVLDDRRRWPVPGRPGRRAGHDPDRHPPGQVAGPPPPQAGDRRADRLKEIARSRLTAPPTATNPVTTRALLLSVSTSEILTRPGPSGVPGFAVASAAMNAADRCARSRALLRRRAPADISRGSNE